MICPLWTSLWREIYGNLPSHRWFPWFSICFPCQPSMTWPPCWEMTRKGHRTELEAMKGDLGESDWEAWQDPSPHLMIHGHCPFQGKNDGKSWEHVRNMMGKWWNMISRMGGYRVLLHHRCFAASQNVTVLKLSLPKLHHPVGGLHLCRADASEGPLMISIPTDKSSPVEIVMSKICGKTRNVTTLTRCYWWLLILMIIDFKLWDLKWDIDPVHQSPAPAMVKKSWTEVIQLPSGKMLSTEMSSWCMLWSFKAGPHHQIHGFLVGKTALQEWLFFDCLLHTFISPIIHFMVIWNMVCSWFFMFFSTFCLFPWNQVGRFRKTHCREQIKP